ncbi:MAG: SDR family oxidoreductase [Myxococcales bacterium]|nr:SDR family oxidoreductase [Myxococcales bacterium]
MSDLALITGGAVRVGAATSRALAEAGYTVVIHARRHLAAAEALAAELGGHALGADLADRAALEDLMDAVAGLPGRLAVLVNNAAVFERAAPEAVSADVFDSHLEINLRAPFRLAQRAHGLMQPAGHIVNILDISALRPYPGYAHYSAAKAGLLALTTGLAAAWAPAIRVNAVSPGPVLAPEGAADPSGFNTRTAQSPQGRAPGAAAVAAAVRFLVEGPHGITGEVIHVDAGRRSVW